MWNKGVPLENKGVARLLLRKNKRACPTYQVCIERRSVPTVTQRAQSSSNDKDPPRDSRRRARVLDDIEAILDASSRRLQACNEWRLDKEFAEHHWNLPRDEDYYLLLEDCKEKYYVLNKGPRACTFREVLMTSGSIAEHPTSASGPTHTLGEPKLHRLPSLLSSCANAQSVEPACNIRVNDNASSMEPSSIRNVQECLPRPRNKMCELSMAYSLPTRVLRLSSLARKTRIASRVHPYAGTRLNGRKRCLIATEPAEEGLDTNAKSLRHNEGLEADAKSLCCAESLDTDINLLRRRESPQANARLLRCIPVVPRHSSGKVPSSSTTKQRRAVSENDEQSISECSPAPEAALMPQKLPIFSTQAISPHRNGGESQPPRTVVTERRGSTNVVNSSPKSVIDVSAHLVTRPGANTNAPKDAVLRPGVDPPWPGEVRHIQPPNEAPSTTLWPVNEPAASNEETSARKHALIAKAAPTPSDHLPAVATQAASFRPTKSETRPPLPVALG